MNQGILYIVATPIGNMGDITRRAVETLQAVDFVAAEDTRVSGKLLMLLDIKKPFVSYHEHNKKQKGAQIIERIKNGESCALITDAGTPAISDPGSDIVAMCRQDGVRVVPIPGVSAVVTAVSVCGLEDGRFLFEGFLNENKSKRRDQLESLCRIKYNIVFYSAPHNVLNDLKDIYKFFGEREVHICRELTKLNETLVSCTLSESIEKTESGEIVQKGEFVIVVGGYKEKTDNSFWAGMTVEEHIKYYTDSGIERMDAIKKTAKDRGVPKGEIYNLVCRNKNDGS